MLEEGAEAPILLLVDDDKVFCKVLKAALERRGFDVIVGHTLEKGLQLVVEKVPDYAVIDLRIGYDSGLELVKKLLSVNEDAACIMLTGFASIATAVEAIKLGAVHYLTKPTNADEIVNALKKNEGDASVVINKKPPSAKRLEWEHLQKVLQQHQGNISAAARALNMHRRTLQRKLEKKPVRD